MILIYVVSYQTSYIKIRLLLMHKSTSCSGGNPGRVSWKTSVNSDTTGIDDRFLTSDFVCMADTRQAVQPDSIRCCACKAEIVVIRSPTCLNCNENGLVPSFQNVTFLQINCGMMHSQPFQAISSCFCNYWVLPTYFLVINLSDFIEHRLYTMLTS